MFPNYRLSTYRDRGKYTLERRIFGLWVVVKEGNLVDIGFGSYFKTNVWLKYHTHVYRLYRAVLKNPHIKSIRIRNYTDKRPIKTIRYRE